DGVKGKVSPCGVWGKAPGILSRHGVIWRSQQGLAEPTPNAIWYSGLYQNFGFALSRYVMIVSKVVLLRKTIVREKHAEISNF
ncbi:hypothetical protein COL26_30815, partial [Bacillus thuringiensis]